MATCSRVVDSFVPITTSASETTRGEGSRDTASQLNTMSKFLALGESLDNVIAQSTWNPAREIKREELGHLSEGAIADVSVFGMETGEFGFVDSFGARHDGTQKLICEMTFKDGLLAWDLNGRTRQDWRELPLDYSRQGDSRWDGILNRRRRPRP